MYSTTDLHCYRCGASLAELTPPISRHDECPDCSVYLHVCRMCQFFDPHVPKKCTEDDAEEVIEKERLNFCDWYQPSASKFDPQRAAEESRARGELESLFSDDEGVNTDGNGAQRDAEDLFN